MKKKALRILLWTVGLLGAISILFALNYLVNDIEEDSSKKKVKVAEKDNYNQEGLPLGMKLSEIPYFEDESYVIYSDRLLKKFKYDESQIEIQRKILENLTSIIPEGLDSYIIPIPSRIVWEGDYLLEGQGYDNFIQEIRIILPEDMKFLNVLPILKDHSKENLFFRTENSWTSRGAYYGSELLFKNLGLETIPLEEYDEHMYSSFEGLDKIELLNKYREYREVIEKLNEIPLDPNFYYLIPNSKNMAIRTKKWEEQLIRENIKVVSKVRKGQGTFIGDNYLYAVVEGDGINQIKKDKTLLVLSDLSGHMVLPFLSPYYERIYIINMINFEYSPGEFENIFKEYDISELIIVQQAESMGDISKSKFFKGILNVNEK